jgi:acyl dehydratase
MIPYPRGKFFEDYQVGQEFATHGRTITEADVLAFGGLTGDFNPLHFDEEYAKHSPFKVRIPHGLCTVSIATGLIDRLGVLPGTALACLEIHWKFFHPVLMGDTIRVVMKVIDKKESSKGDRGIVAFEMPVFNQREERVNEGSWRLMIAKRHYFESKK